MGEIKQSIRHFFFKFSYIFLCNWNIFFLNNCPLSRIFFIVFSFLPFFLVLFCRDNCAVDVSLPVDFPVFRSGRWFSDELAESKKKSVETNFFLLFWRREQYKHKLEGQKRKRVCWVNARRVATTHSSSAVSLWTELLKVLFPSLRLFGFSTLCVCMLFGSHQEENKKRENRGRSSVEKITQIKKNSCKKKRFFKKKSTREKRGEKTNRFGIIFLPFYVKEKNV